MTVVRIAGKVVNSNISVGDTATAIPATAAVGRIFILVTNNGSVTVYIGDSNVTTTNGYPLAPGDAVSLDLKEQVVLYGRTATGTADVRIIEGV